MAPRLLSHVLLNTLLALAVSSAYGADLVLPVGGRVTIDLTRSGAQFRDTLAITSPVVGVAIGGCKVEVIEGVGGVVVSEKVSQRGCRAMLDADPATPGIQPFAAGTVMRFTLCAQQDADPECEFTWSSDPSANSDGKEHLRTIPHPSFPNQVFQLNWEDRPNLGDMDFNDLIATVRVDMDTDGDGLWDDWEQFGIDIDGDGVIDFALPGANPRHKDLFVEIDWMDCAVPGSDCAAGDIHSHRPKDAAINAVIQAFANAAVSNPDGVNGITLHVNVNHAVAHQDALNIPGLCFAGGVGIGDFDAIKATNFGLNDPRSFVYHYGLFTHRQAPAATSSGCAELPGNDFQVSFGAWNLGLGDIDGDGLADADVGTVAQQAGTLMHLLGHNLGLDHGGGDGVNFKPNYLSVMSFTFQVAGVPPTDPDGSGPLLGRVDFSRSQLASLNEAALDGSAGIGDGSDNTFYRCPNFALEGGAGTGAIDWRCGTPPDTSALDINGDRLCVGPGPDGVLDTAPNGDDAVLASERNIADGPDRTCNTAAAGDDEQRRAVGNVQPEVLAGFEDWANLRYDFQTTSVYQDGDHAAAPVLRELDYAQSLRFGTDLAVTKSASAKSIRTGTNVAYTIKLQNKGPAQAQAVLVKDHLPAATTFVSCNVDGGGMCGGSGNDRKITFPSLGGGASATITLVAKANCAVPEGTAIANIASASSASPEMNQLNNAGRVNIKASNPPPKIDDIAARPKVLSPPNGKLIDVTVDYAVKDTCGPVKCMLSVASNERSDDDTKPDWVVIDDHHVKLRAERSDKGKERVYTVTATCTDSAGGSSHNGVAVTVPKDRGK